jgi:hypothetical protein
VATDFNNLAALLHDTNRLGEAEPLFRRMLLIFARFKLSTTHQHPHWQTAQRNYSLFLEELNLAPSFIHQRLATIERGDDPGDYK